MKETLVCHECDGDAVGTCRVCSKAFCGGHGADLCRHCATAIVAVDPARGGASRQAFLQCVSKPRMKTVYLDDDGPPECYRCEAYAKYICQKCQNLCCRDHVGEESWCQDCLATAKRSTLVAVLVLGGMFALFGTLAVLQWLRGD